MKTRNYKKLIAGLMCSIGLLSAIPNEIRLQTIGGALLHSNNYTQPETAEDFAKVRQNILNDLTLAQNAIGTRKYDSIQFAIRDDCYNTTDDALEAILGEQGLVLCSLVKSTDRNLGFTTCNGGRRRPTLRSGQ